MIDNPFPFDIGAFVTKLNVEGSAPVYSTFLGGSAFRFDIIGRYRIKCESPFRRCTTSTRSGPARIVLMN